MTGKLTSPSLAKRPFFNVHRTTLARIALFMGVAGCVWALFTGPLLTQVELSGDGENELFQAWAAAHTEWELSHGPTIAGKFDIHLGTGWIRLMQVLLPWMPTPMSVYKVHVAVTALAVALLFAVAWIRINPWTAVITCLMLILSVFLVRTIRVVCHPGMVPAMGALWFSGVILALTSSRDRVRGWWLVGAWCTVAFFMQLHLVVLPYAATLLGIQAWFWWRGGWRKAPVATVLSGLLALWVGMEVVPLVWAVMHSDLMQQQATTMLPSEWVTYWITMFGSAWTEGATDGLRLNGLGIVVLCAAGVGLVRACRQNGTALERWTALLVVMGSVMTTMSLQVGLGSRYAGTCGPGVCLLAGLTLSSFRVPLPKVRWKMQAGLALVVFLALFDPIQWRWVRAEHVRVLPTLSVVEQEASLQALMSHRALDWETLRTRVHGWAGTAQAHRFPVLAMGLVRPSLPAPDDAHFTLVTPRQPPPAYRAETWSFDGGAGRLLTWVKHAPRFTYEEVRFSSDERPCRANLPYSNIPQPSLDVLEAVGMQEPWPMTALGTDGQPCRLRVSSESKQRLTIELPAVVGTAPLTLLVTPAQSVEDLKARSATGRALSVEPYNREDFLLEGKREIPGFAVYRVAVREGEGLQISLPKEGLSGVDIY